MKGFYMFSKNKGTYGYLKKQPIKIGLFALLLIAFSGFIFLFGYFKSHDVKNIFTVIGVLGMLPGAKAIVSFIMQLKAEKFSCPKELFDKCDSLLKNSGLSYGYDFYLTSYKINYPIPVCVVCDKSVICYLNMKNETGSCSEHINKYLQSNAIEGYKAYVFDNEDKFIRRIGDVCDKFKPADKDAEALQLMKNLSL